MTTENAEGRAYLSKLERGLKTLPKEERDAIVAEIASHIADSGRLPVQEVLDHLGDPTELAQAYVEQYQLADALDRPAHASLLFILLDRAGRNVVALVTALSAAVLYAFALSFIAMAVLKPIMPQNVGLWWGATFALGVFDKAPAGTRELLGYWIVPLAVLAAVLCYMAATKLMRLGGRRLLRQSIVQQG